jgi:hypothetical protein
MGTIEEDWINQAATFAAAHAETIGALLTSAGKKVDNAIRLRIRSTYERYLTRLADKYGKAKTFFIRDELTPLYTYFVPLSATCGSKRIKTVDAQSLEEVGHFLILDGSAGSGKSTLLRHLMLNEIVRKQKVPLYIELRGLNGTKPSQLNLDDVVRNSISALDLKLDDEYLAKALELGHFTLLLDGYDEVEPSLRPRLGDQVRKFVDRYPKNNVWIASRPDQEFVGWAHFAVVSTLPLDLNRACALVEKLPADAELKEKFVADLRGGLYAKHESFLSNPLLLTIMLLTYGQSADIPTRVSLFYNQAYEALYQGHDALKGAFKRRRKTSLDMQEFADVFAAMAVQTYDTASLRFSRMDLLTVLNHAKAITGVDFSADDFLDDSLRAVCLLLQDGLTIGFAHRSFQEYFVARFIAAQPPEIQLKLLHKYIKRYPRDAVVPILHEIVPRVVEDYIILPYLDELAKGCGVKRRVGITHWWKYFSTTWTSISLGRESNVRMLLAHKLGDSMRRFEIERLITRLYGSQVDFSSRVVFADEKRIVDEIQKLGTEKGGEFTYKFKSASTRSSVVKMLFESQGYWGRQGLQALLDIRDHIRSSRKSQRETAFDILKLAT